MKKTQEITSKVEGNPQTIWGIPVFFAVRAGGWYLLAIAAVVISLAWELTMGFPSKSFIVLMLILAGLFCWSGSELLHVAVKKRYFTRVLTCQDTGLSRVSTQIRNFIDPTSTTPFRISKQASFTADDGMRVTFTFDRIRKFHVGAKYLFYFRLPTYDMAEITAEHLEYLKIDHAILPAAKL